MRMLTLVFLLLSVSPVYADVFNADAVDLTATLDLIIKNMAVDGTPLDVALNRYNHPNDPAGLYWQLGPIAPGLQLKTVHKRTETYLDAEPLARHQLDIYHTDHPETNKVIMFVPGGAWRQGDKDAYDALGRALAGYYDFTVAVVNYRLSNDDDGNATHPDHIQDVAAAFAWLKTHVAPYGNPNQLYLFGQSAGAHLVSLLATDDSYLKAVGYALSDIQAVISMSGSYYLPDLVTYPNNPLGLTADEVVMFKKLMQDAFGGWSDADLLAPSPQMHISPDQPPFLIIYTYNDISGFAREAENFIRAARNLKTPPEMSLRAIEFSDYTDEVWNIAASQAAQEPALSAFVGHWAEVVAINPNEPQGYVTRLVVEFLQSH